MRIETGGALSPRIVTDSADWPRDEAVAVHDVHDMRVYLADLEREDPAWFVKAHAILDAGIPMNRARAEAARIRFAIRETAPEDRKWGLFVTVPSCPRCINVTCSCD